MSGAWADDWIKQSAPTPIADSSDASGPKLTKVERRAKQAEFNRQIWEDAEKHNENYFLKSREVVPLRSDFQPSVKLLSRKPTPKSANAPTQGLGQLSLEDDDDDDDGESGTRKVISHEARMQKVQQEREERQRAYEERRKELFGSGTTNSTPGSTTVASHVSSKVSPQQRKAASPRNQSKANQRVVDSSRPSSSASNRARQLYDPHEATKPENIRPQRRDLLASSNEIRPIREPRNPANSVTTGAGFASRGSGR